ncbi:MAG: hypothetical protein Q8M76_09020, partial [Spirochaetaceae bacterium]|nr:hypothetical protein [Spirochaetaceae bacterium]
RNGDGRGRGYGQGESEQSERWRGPRHSIRFRRFRTFLVMTTAMAPAAMDSTTAVKALLCRVAKDQIGQTTTKVPRQIAAANPKALGILDRRSAIRRLFIAQLT